VLRCILARHNLRSISPIVAVYALQILQKQRCFLLLLYAAPAHQLDVMRAFEVANEKSQGVAIGIC
jgi:hypothetical protein